MEKFKRKKQNGIANGVRGICRPGGFSATDELIRLSGLGTARQLCVLDVGCGEGATVEYLRRLHPAWDVSGIDPNPPAGAAGRIMPGKAEQLPFSDKSMDILLMECSFSKTQDPERALLEAFRVLKPEGMLLMSDMFAKKRELVFDRMLGRLDFAERIWRRLTDAGFSVLEMQDRSGFLSQWIGQQILDGNGELLCEMLGADRETLRGAGCGYFICAARPSALWETLRYAEKNSPFYRAYFREARGAGIRPGEWERFRGLPFTTQDQIRENPERFLCVPAKEIARIITLRTSGSSGKPKRLFFTEEDLLKTADFFEEGMRYMVRSGDRVAVYMEGPGFFSIGGLLRAGMSRIGVEVTVHGLIRDMTLAAADGEGQNCFVGVPSQMYGLAAHAPHLRPDTVLLSADYVPESVIKFLEDTWKCKVFTHWGMTETGYGGGVQCAAREGYHLRDADLLLEVIDPATGQNVPNGEYGELVLTTLGRKGMPLIRYRTGDRGKLLTEPCGCGCLKPRLAKVEGRLRETVVLPEGKHLSMHILDELLLSTGEIQDFWAAFDREKQLLLVTVMKSIGSTDKSPAGDAAKSAANILRRHYGNRLKIQVEEKDISPYIGSGKRRLVIKSKEGTCGIS